MIGILIGVFVTFKMPKTEKKDVTEYLNESIQLIRENKLDKQSLFKEKLLENFKDVRNYLAFRVYDYSKFNDLYFYYL